MRGWIPPLPLALGTLSFGLSWVLLFEVARSGGLDASMPALAWVHAVALAWVTTIALSILLHAIPAFVDVEWSGSRAAIARACTLLFAICALGLVAGFWFGALRVLEVAGTAAFVVLLIYAAAIGQALIAAMRGERVARAIARAFVAVLVALVLTAALGALFTLALGGLLPSRLLVGWPPAHALLGIGGWLTLLVVGVSARTMAPLAGTRSRFLALHVGSSTALAVGVLVAAIAAAFYAPAFLLAGCALLFIGALAYATDIADIVRRATVPHRPPQAFMLCAAAWALASTLLLAGAVLGLIDGATAVYAALIGWVGNAVLAHVHHIGVRALLTTLLGDEDETRPQDVLDARVSWTTFALYESAAIVGTGAIALRAPSGLLLASALGFASFLAIAGGLTIAAGRARRLDRAK